MAKDTSKLVKKVITNTKGKQQTVWVKNDKSNEKRKTSKDILTSKVDEYRKHLKTAEEIKMPTESKGNRHKELSDAILRFKSGIAQGKENVWYKVKGRDTLMRIESRGKSVTLVNFNPNDKSMAVVVTLTKNNKVSKKQLGK